MGVRSHSLAANTHMDPHCNYDKTQTPFHRPPGLLGPDFLCAFSPACGPDTWPFLQASGSSSEPALASPKAVSFPPCGSPGSRPPSFATQPGSLPHTPGVISSRCFYWPGCAVAAWAFICTHAAWEEGPVCPEYCIPVTSPVPGAWHI